ncbi:MAG: sigma-70 family RNA polymerase sigma factor [Candidatus Obscuribacterales bacterium]|nr:sigma-70 family RNA polymerase sigma factor [Candidatus Obscuribacterales bacterium]
MSPQSQLTPMWFASLVKDKLNNAQDLTALADAELVRRSRAGDNKAFELLLRRYQKLVYNVIYQMLRNHDTASDLTQDTFLKAYKALPSFDTQKSFKPWLLKIATNLSLNSIRDNKHQQSLDELLEVNPQAEPVSVDDVEQEVEWRVSQHMLFEALGELPLKQREAFVLRYQHDLPYEEIAEISELSVSSVKSLLFRARENLRKLLTGRLAVQASTGGD